MIVRGALALASRGRLSILIFHRVLPAPDVLLPGEPSAAEFEALLGHLARRFKVLPLADAVRRLADGTLPPAALAITFDDGYADNLDLAAPILAKHGLPATVFVAPGYLDGGAMFNDRVREGLRTSPLDRLDLREQGLGEHALATPEARRDAIEAIIPKIKYLGSPAREAAADAVVRAARGSVRTDLMMTRAQVPRLYDHGVDVGAHTLLHPILAKAAPDVARREIVESKVALEALTGRACTLFAYPNGRPGSDFGPEHVAMVREAGFAAAVTTAPGTGSAATDPWQLPRFTPWTRAPLKFDLLMLRNLRLREAA